MLCLVFSFFFSGIETGLLAINRVRLRAMVRKRNRRAAIIARYLDRPEMFLSTSLVGNAIVNTTATVLVAHRLHQWHALWGGWVAFVAMMCVLYVLCELVPKSLFRQFPTRLTVWTADVFQVLHMVLTPVVWFFSLITSASLRGFGESKPREQIYVSREELKRLALDSEAGGQFTSEERRMIQEVFNFRHLTLQQIMTSWDQVASVSADATAAEVVNVSRETGCSRLPALDASRKLAGVVSVYDILFDSEPTETKTARDYLRRAHTLPAQTPIDQGLQRLRATQQPLAIVIDNKEQPIGIVTIEDMLAKLIGEIEG